MKQYHKLKIFMQYADAVVAGEKTFEVRQNDRNFQKGDWIIFDCREEDGRKFDHSINRKYFEITYVLSWFPEALKDGYVVLGIKATERERKV